MKDFFFWGGGGEGPMIDIYKIISAVKGVKREGLAWQEQ